MNLDTQQIESFLRGAHIFATTVKKVLEEQYLREATEDRLSFPQYNVLKLLQHRTARHVGDVAHFLDVSYPAASKIVDRLHKLDLLSRREDPRDRRASCLALAPRGADLIKRYEQHKNDATRTLLAHLEPHEVAAIGPLLEKLSASILRDTSCHPQVCMQCGAYVHGECPLEKEIECVYAADNST